MLSAICYVWLEKNLQILVSSLKERKWIIIIFSMRICPGHVWWVLLSAGLISSTEALCAQECASHAGRPCSSGGLLSNSLTRYSQRKELISMHLTPVNPPPKIRPLSHTRASNADPEPSGVCQLFWGQWSSALFSWWGGGGGVLRDASAAAWGIWTMSHEPPDQSSAGVCVCVWERERERI